MLGFKQTVMGAQRKERVFNSAKGKSCPLCLGLYGTRSGLGAPWEGCWRVRVSAGFTIWFHAVTWGDECTVLSPFSHPQSSVSVRQRAGTPSLALPGTPSTLGWSWGRGSVLRPLRRWPRSDARVSRAQEGRGPRCPDLPEASSFPLPPPTLTAPFLTMGIQGGASEYVQRLCCSHGRGPWGRRTEKPRPPAAFLPDPLPPADSSLGSGQPLRGANFSPLPVTST